MENSKTAMRRQVRDTTASFSKKYIDTANEAILQNILSLPEYQNAKTIFAYYSMGIEPDTLSIIQHALENGKTVAIPRTFDKGAMEARVITNLDGLVIGKYDIPTAPADAPLLETADIDFVLVPAVAFDRRGYRLGRGGGYYDRFLGKSSSFSVGLAFEKALLDAVPTEAHDMPTHCLVTEKEIARLC